MASNVKEDKDGKGAADFVLDLYSNLLFEIWEIVSALIGEAILALLFLAAIRKIGEKYPFLMFLKVSEQGMILDRVKEEGRILSPVEIHHAFQSLINHLFQLFSGLTEGVINKELFPKVIPRVKEVERFISQK
jgi:hypothetical protein